MSAPLLWLSLAFVAGAGVRLGAGGEWWAWATLLAVSASAALVAGMGRAGWVGPAAAMLFAVGLWTAGDAGPVGAGELAPATGAEVVVTGVVESDPVRSGAGQQIRVAVESVAVGGDVATLRGDVLLRTEPGVGFAYGDRVRGRTVLRPLSVGAGGSPFETYLAEQGVQATGFLTAAERVASHQGNRLREWVSDARAWVDGGLTRAFGEPLAGLTQGIVTGRRDALDRGVRDELNAAGVSHLVVISGGNVAIVASLVAGALAWAIGRRPALALALVVVGLYTVFVGAEAPVVRAAIMAATLVTAQALGRRTDAAPAIALAAAVMTALSPGVLTDLSFQLSFAATAAIALIAGPLRWRVAGRLGYQRGSGASWLAWVGLDTMIVTSAAIAGTLPLLALHFGQVSLVALPANLLVTPVFTWIFLGSFATGVLGALVPDLAPAVGGVLAWLPLRWFVGSAQALARLPFATTPVDGFGEAHAAVLFASLLGVAAWLSGPRRRRAPSAPLDWRRAEAPAALAVSGALAAVALTLWWAVLSGDPDTLDVYVLDVGQGDSLLARTPDGTTLLVDGGPDGRALLRELGEALPRRRRIDVVVATHPQADHVAGLFALLDRYEVGTLLMGPGHEAIGLGQRLRDEALAAGARVEVAQPGMRIALGDAVVAEVLGPVTGLSASGRANVNNEGVVLRLRHEAVSMLLAADLEAEAELLLARGPWELRSTVLKVAHHGSATSTTDLLLRRVSPALAVISVGANNTFGHPHPEVLARLAQTVVLRTDVDGRIRLRSDGTEVRYQSVARHAGGAKGASRGESPGPGGVALGGRGAGRRRQGGEPRRVPWRRGRGAG